MFTCCMCKKQFDGEPKVKNACGSFCAKCDSARNEKARNAQFGAKRAAAARRGGGVRICPWCGRATDAPATREDPACRVCAKSRLWLSECIKFSDHVEKYVVPRSAKARDQRRAAKVVKSAPVLPLPLPTPTPSPIPVPVAPPSPVVDRVAALETIIEKIARELGVI